MYCKNCGKPVPENTKFCTSCGNPVEQQTPVQQDNAPEQNNFQPQQPQQTFIPPAPPVQNGYDQNNFTYQEPAPKKSNKKLIAILASAGGALLIAGIIIAVMFFVKPMTGGVPGAVINTLSTIEDESEALADSLPIITFFEDYFEEPYQIDFSYQGYTGTINGELLSDFEEEKIKVALDAMGIGGELLVSSDLLTVSLPSLLGDGTYGIKTSEIIDLFSEYTGMETSTTDFDLFDTTDFDTFEEIGEITAKHFDNIINDLETEELGKESLTINDITVDADGYTLKISNAKIKAHLTALVEELFANPSFSAFLEGFSLSYYSASVTPSELKQELLDEIALIPEESDNDSVVSIYIYDNRVVSFVADDGSERTEILLNPTGKILDYVKVTTNASVTTITTTFENNVLDFKAVHEDLLYAYTSTVGLIYDTAGDAGNFTFYDDYSSFTFDVVSKSETELAIAINIDDEALTLVMEKGNMPADWFNQPTDYQSLEDLLSQLMGLSSGFGF